MKDFENKELRIGDGVVVAISGTPFGGSFSTLSRGVVESLESTFAYIRLGNRVLPFPSKSIMKISDGNVITASFSPRNGPIQVLDGSRRERQECDLLSA